MIRVACAPTGTLLPTNVDVPFVLFDRRPDAATGAVGSMIPPYLKGLGLQPSARAWDFLSIALSVVAADESVLRTSSPDGWTRVIELTIAVVDAHFWTSQAQALQSILQFVTGDIWLINFIDGGFLPAPPQKTKLRNEDVICLLSGGMDSMVGAIDLVAKGLTPLLVSQVAKGDKKDQKTFARTIAPKSWHLQLNHNARPPATSERSQRARSLAFFGLGVVAGTCTTHYASGATIDLIVPENGFISLNIPLTPLRIGSLSTRTTHPIYLNKLQDVFDSAGIRIRLLNPYQEMTKGEMLTECKNQPLLKQLIGATTSCGRYARTGFRQCGRCVPCLVRRASFVRWGEADSTRGGYKYGRLGTPNRDHRDFDDVRSVAYAIYKAQTRGFKAWAGGNLNSAQLGSTTVYEGVAQRGLDELETFLASQGAL
jgi:hypothetical protein